MWKLVHLDDVAEESGSYPAPADHVVLSRYRNLGKAAGTVRLGMSLERMAPGEHSSLTHAHSAEEECAYVLSGTCTLRLVEPGAEPRQVPVRAGDFISFPAGTAVAHSFVNESSDECLLMVVGERRDDDRVFYPEHPDYDAKLARERPQRHWAPADRPT
jgi:uncharacterized cupin superfamily protein